MKKTFFITLIVMLTVLVLNTGCKAKQTDVPITIAINDDIVSLDPHGTKDTLSETLARCVFGTLYTFDEQMNLIPYLVESEERESEYEWIFHLRNGILFHDGSPLTAHDVKFSLERAKIVERADKNLNIITDVSVIDQNTVKITTAEPVSNLPSVLVRVSTSVMSEKAMAKSDYDINRPVGSGPFRVIGRVIGSSIHLERFDEYKPEPAKNKYLDFIVEPSEQKRTTGLLNKKFSVVYRTSPNDGDYLKLSDSVTVYEKGSTKMEIFSFNPTKPPLDDIRVRQAISYAINKQNIVDMVVSGYGKPINSMIPPPLMGALDYDGFAYDPEKSRALLDEAGYPDGFELRVITFDELRKKMMEYIKLDLAQVGIRLNYEFLDLQNYLDYIVRNEHMSSIMSWVSDPDPDSTFSQLFSKKSSETLNQSKFTNERVEQLILEGKKETDPQKRRVIYEEANRIIASSYFVLPLYQPSLIVAASNEIGGIHLNSQGLFGYEYLFFK